MENFDRDKEDIVVERTQEERLRIAVETAERASQAKSEFINRMSHDIRTPLNAIIGMTDIAAVNIDNKGRVQDCLEKISRSGNHLLKLINEILDMTKIESGKLEIRENELNLGDLTDDILAMVKPQISEKNHEFEVRVHNIVHEDLLGDQLRIKEVLVNLLSNAIKYTDYGGKISMDITEMESEIKDKALYEVIVRDNGIGMDSEFMKHIFDPFSRASNSVCEQVQGTGLGMTIARDIAKLLGGDIRVKSIPGEGSEFTVTMYLKYFEREENQGEKFSILIVDKDIEESKCVIQKLNNQGIRCDICKDGTEAVNVAESEALSGRNYDVILLGDPGEDGAYIHTAEKLAGSINRKSTVLGLMSYDWRKVEEEARRAGIQEFITKPLFSSKILKMSDRISRKENTKQEGTVGRLRKADFSGYRVLIVEDNELNLEIASEIVGTTGAEVETAANGLEAVRMIADSPEAYYHLIFMDIRMPKMDGYKAAKEIRSLNRGDVRNIPIIAMTANAFADDVTMSRNAGMNDHVVKPLNISRLIGTMEKWLPGKKSVDE